MKHFTHQDNFDDAHDLRMEFAPRRQRAAMCSDRMCGAEDCENCFPQPWGFKAEEAED